MPTKKYMRRFVRVGAPVHPKILDSEIQAYDIDLSLRLFNMKRYPHILDQFAVIGMLFSWARKQKTTIDRGVYEVRILDSFFNMKIVELTKIV